MWLQGRIHVGRHGEETYDPQALAVRRLTLAIFHWCLAGRCSTGGISSECRICWRVLVCVVMFHLPVCKVVLAAAAAGGDGGGFLLAWVYASNAPFHLSLTCVLVTS